MANLDRELTSPSSSKPARKQKRATGDDTIFAMNLFYKTTMKIDFFNYGTTIDYANLTMSETVDSYIRLQGSDDGTVKVTSSNQEAAYEYDRIGEVGDWQESTDTILLDKGTRELLILQFMGIRRRKWVLTAIWQARNP